MKFHLCALPLLALLLSRSCLFSQDCGVANNQLRGTYTGDCKNGKANGKGKAVGTDTYEGEFRDGLPNGQGTYTWSNGTSYNGSFVKGHLQGEGLMRYKKAGFADSIVQGFWKNDNYIGKYEKPYKIYAESEHVVQVNVKFKKDNLNRVNFYVVNTTSSTRSLAYGSGTKMKVDDLGISLGSYQRMENYDYMKKTETILFNVDYPLHMKLRIATEEIDMELFEEGSYTIDVNINK